jgi:hypothetical protein
MLSDCCGGVGLHIAFGDKAATNCAAVIDNNLLCFGHDNSSIKNS